MAIKFETSNINTSNLTSNIPNNYEIKPISVSGSSYVNNTSNRIEVEEVDLNPVVEEKSWWNSFMDNWHHGIEVIGESLGKTESFKKWDQSGGADITKIVLSTGGNVLTGVGKGIFNTVEGIADTAVNLVGIVATPFTGLIDGIGYLTGNDLGVTNRLWNDGIKQIVGCQVVDNTYNAYYSDYGKIMNDNAHDWFKTDAIGYQVSEIIGTVLGTLAGGKMLGKTGVLGEYTGITSNAGKVGSAITAGFTGFGQGTEDAWNDGADVLKGLSYGTLTGILDFSQYMIGGKINEIKILSGSSIISKLGSAGFRVLLDGLDSAVEVPLRSLFKSGYNNKSWNDNFNEAGGFSSVLTQFLIGAGISAGSEGVQAISSTIKTKRMELAVTDPLPENKIIEDITDPLPENKMTEAITDPLPENKMTEVITDPLPENKMFDAITEPLPITLKELKYNKQNPVKSAAAYMESNVKKYWYTDVNKINGMPEYIKSEKLYHFTNNPDAILNSGYIKASNMITSYGNPKSFFFAGVPDAGSYVANIGDLHLKTVAIEVDPKMSTINSSHMKIRNLDDCAITYDGKFKFSNADNVQKKYFCLFKENDELVYKNVSESFYNNYQNTPDGQAIQEFLSKKSNVNAIKNDYFVDLSFNKTRGNICKTANLYSIVASIDFNKKNLIEGISSKIPKDLDDLTKARLNYLKLNEAVSYSDQYAAVRRHNSQISLQMKETLYTKSFDVRNMDTSNVVCSNWTDIYKELLIDSGIDPTKIYVMGGNNIGSHRWISVDLGNGKLLMADATNNYGGMTDLTASKLKMDTCGFFTVDANEWAQYEKKLGSNGAMKELWRRDDIAVDKIDMEIGYNSNSSQIYELEDMYKFDDNIKISTDEKLKTFMNIFDSDASTIDSYSAYKKFAGSILGENSHVSLYMGEQDMKSVITFDYDDGSLGYLIKEGNNPLRITDENGFISAINGYERLR